MSRFLVHRIWRGAAVLSAVCSAWVLAGVPVSQAQSAGGQLVVHFVDVGQGSATWLSLPDGRTALVDCGPVAQGKQLVLRLESAGVQQIDLLVATSPRADASGGCADVMNYLGVSQVLVSGAPGTTAAWTAFQSLFQAGPALVVNAGSQQVGDWGAVRARVFNPPATSDPSSLTDTDGSLVLALDYAGYRVLLSGPIHTAGERAALDAGLGSGPATVLAVADHGAATATSDALVNAVFPPGGNPSPRFAVISNAAKDPAQPDPKVIGRLQAAGAQVLSTAANGMVTITLPGAGGQPVLQTER